LPRLYDGANLILSTSDGHLDSDMIAPEVTVCRSKKSPATAAKETRKQYPPSFRYKALMLAAVKGWPRRPDLSKSSRR